MLLKTENCCLECFFPTSCLDKDVEKLLALDAKKSPFESDVLALSMVKSHAHASCRPQLENRRHPEIRVPPVPYGETTKLPPICRR